MKASEVVKKLVEKKVVSVKDKRYTLKDFEPFLENGGGEKDKMPFEEIFKGLPKTKRDVEMTRQIGRWITQGFGRFHRREHHLFW